MATTTFPHEERVGLLGSIAAHVVLILLLVVGLPLMRSPPPPERISVTISDDVGLTSTSPDPNAQAAPDTGPEIGEAPAPAPVPEIVPSPIPTPQPRATPVPAPRPTAAPQPRPSPSSRTAAAPRPPQARADSHPQPRQPGNSRFSDAFRQGIPGGQQEGNARTPPGQTAGPAVLASLSSAISRQIKPHWTAPDGVDVDKLVTVLAWDLNPDGTLAGTPRVVSQTGVTEANAAQKTRHAEQAIRAVRLAAPFQLPPQFYSAWRRVSSFRFDRRLSQ